MKFLATLRAELLKKFPFQMNKIRERSISEIFVLADGTTTYTGSFTEGTGDVATTQKLKADEKWVSAGTSIEIGKVVGGNFAQVEWTNKLDPNIFSAAQIAELRQIFAAGAKLKLYYGEDDTLYDTEETRRYLAGSATISTVGDYERFTPNFDFIVHNGDKDYKVVLELPTGSTTTTFTVANALAVRITKIGMDISSVCGSKDALFAIPAACEESCNCNGNTTQNAFAPRMVANTTKDLGFLV